jgi:two-component sensor histidine kinase
VVAGQFLTMHEVSTAVELLRHRFRHGEPAAPLRHHARDVLQGSLSLTHDSAFMDDVVIVISELVQNVTQHTAGHGEIVISHDVATVLVEVGDSSTTIPRPCTPDPLRIGGRGLSLVQAICRQWGVRTCTEGKVVWARLPTLTPAPAPGAA